MKSNALVEAIGRVDGAPQALANPRREESWHIAWRLRLWKLECEPHPNSRSADTEGLSMDNTNIRTGKPAIGVPYKSPICVLPGRPHNT